MQKLEGKVAVVSGASKGIGASIALVKFHQQPRGPLERKSTADGMTIR